MKEERKLLIKRTKRITVLKELAMCDVPSMTRTEDGSREKFRVGYRDVLSSKKSESTFYPEVCSNKRTKNGQGWS